MQDTTHNHGLVFRSKGLILRPFFVCGDWRNGANQSGYQQMLGHTKISTTQIYARIVDKTINDEMDKLASAFNGTKFRRMRVNA